MLKHTPPNRPYDLTTKQGRAQSYAHSGHGAFLARAVEQCLQEQEENISDQINQLIEKELDQLNPIYSSDENLLQEFSLFHSELGIRDKKEFQKLMTAYSEERQMLHGNIALLTSLINQIKEAVVIDPEEGEGFF